jgi:hypothetical protein
MHAIAGSKRCQQQISKITIKLKTYAYSLYRQLKDAPIEASIRAILVELHTIGVLRRYCVFKRQSLAPDIPQPIRALREM